MNLRRTLARFKPMLALVHLRDVLLFVGIGAVTHGLSMISPPAAWIFAGGVLFWLSIR